MFASFHDKVARAIDQEDSDALQKLAAASGKKLNTIDMRSDLRSYSPLTYCLHRGFKEGVSILLKAGADPNLEDARGCSPLDYAIDMSELPECTPLLIDAGATFWDTKICEALRYGSYQKEILQAVIRKGGAISDDYLGILASERNLTLFEEMLDVRNAQGQAVPIKDTHAFYNCAPDVLAQAAKIMLSKKMQPTKGMYIRLIASDHAQVVDQALAQMPENEKIPFLWRMAVQAMSDRESTVVKVFDYVFSGKFNGLDVNTRLGESKSLLQVSVEQGSTHAQHYLLAHGASPDAADKEGKTAMGVALSSRNTSVIEKFCDTFPQHEAVIDYLSRQARTMCGGRYEVKALELKDLFSKGVSINYADSDGKTLLMYAVEADNAQTVKFLLDHGANSMQTDSRGRTAYDYARGDVKKILSGNMHQVQDANVIVLTRNLGPGRQVIDFYDFENGERISEIIRAGDRSDGADDKCGWVQKRFDEVPLPALRKAFEEHARRGGKASLADYGVKNAGMSLDDAPLMPDLRKTARPET